MGEDVPPEKIDAMFHEVDSDGSGLIEFPEFVALVRKMNPKQPPAAEGEAAPAVPLPEDPTPAVDASAGEEAMPEETLPAEGTVPEEGPLGEEKAALENAAVPEELRGLEASLGAASADGGDGAGVAEASGPAGSGGGEVCVIPPGHPPLPRSPPPRWRDAGGCRHGRWLPRGGGPRGERNTLPSLLARPLPGAAIALYVLSTAPSIPPPQPVSTGGLPLGSFVGGGGGGVN
jgi:hypothetical protein